jgi:hypothetical protein
VLRYAARHREWTGRLSPCCIELEPSPTRQMCARSRAEIARDYRAEIRRPQEGSWYVLVLRSYSPSKKPANGQRLQITVICETVSWDSHRLRSLPDLPSATRLLSGALELCTLSRLFRRRLPSLQNDSHVMLSEPRNIMEAPGRVQKPAKERWRAASNTPCASTSSPSPPSSQSSSPTPSSASAASPPRAARTRAAPSRTR